MSDVVPKIVRREVPFNTPWFSVAEKYLDGEEKPYYSLQMLDYVTVFATSRENKLILVRQFRPAAEKFVLELPSGHVEKDELPEAAARKELLEETGYVADPLQFLGTLYPDTGRLCNKLWCYFAPGAIRSENWKPESGVEVLELEPHDFSRSLTDGRFPHALHLAVVFMAVARGLWRPSTGVQ